MQKAYQIYSNFSHIIYVKAVQPNAVEDNQSRIANKYFQRAVDAMFEHWLYNFFHSERRSSPKLLKIDYWDLDDRKEAVTRFINS